MRIGRFETHPAADLFPLMGEDELAALAEDVRANGLQQALIVERGSELLLDGRNRLRACERVGVVPRVRLVEDIDDPVAYVVSANLHRRHLNESQRAMVAARIATLPRGANQHASIEAPTQSDAAGSLNVGRAQVQRARTVIDKAAPELVAAVDAGQVAVSAAASLAKRSHEEQAAAVHRVVTGEAKDLGDAVRQGEREKRVARLTTPAGIPDGKYRVICADPPWAYDNSGLTQSAADHYDTLPAEEIARRWAADVERVSTPESVLFLWATSPLLPEGLHVMSAWGYTYTASLVWAKDRAPGIGWWAKTRHELLLIGRRDQTPHPAEKVDSIVEASVRAHSQKPEVFYEAIERMYPVCAERPVHLELFARAVRRGWVRGLYNQELAS